MNKTYKEIAEQIAWGSYDNDALKQELIEKALREAEDRGISIGRNLEKYEWLACLEGKDHADKVIEAIRERFPD